MPRIRHLSSAIAVALAFSGAAQAQSFSNVISFGDSLTDAGNVALVDGNVLTPPGSSFTTNTDDVYAQLVAANFGFTQTNSLSGGTNFAFGGACVRANGALPEGFTCGLSPGSFSLTAQLTGYLTATGGVADGNALYTMWGGANDIFTYAGMIGPAPGITPTQAQQLTGLSAQTMVGLIGTMQAAGARHIVVFNLPDLGATPYANALGAQAGFSGLTIAYNTTFNAGLASLGDGIIPVNVYGLVNEVLADPGTYGFTNTTDTACGTLSGSLACGPANDPAGAPDWFFHYADGTNQTYFFADGVHPTGAAHAMLAQAVIAEINAPAQVAMLAEAGLKSYEDQSRVINAQIFDGREREDGTTQGFANVQYSNIDFDATANTPDSSIDQTSLLVGADYRGSERYDIGGALSLASQQIDAGSMRADGRAVTFSLYGVWNFGGAYIDAVIGGGSDNFDTHRHIQLGAADRVEEGNTNGSHTAAELGFGYLFGDDIKHGPFIDVTWQKIDVNDFNEDGGTSTAMTFSSFDRDSLITRIGYQLHGNMGGWHPYARIAYNNESENDAPQVTAGLVSMNGHFTMPGLVPSDDWWTADLGVAWEFNDTSTMSVSFSGLFADDVQDRKTINFGVDMKF